VTVRSYPNDYAMFAAWDNSYIWTKCPPQVDFLTIHGLKDEVVPVYDSVIWADALSRRNPGTHTLHLIEGADHNLVGHHPEVIQVILDWWESHNRQKLKNGLWKNSVQPRL